MKKKLIITTIGSSLSTSIVKFLPKHLKVLVNASNWSNLRTDTLISWFEKNGQVWLSHQELKETINANFNQDKNANRIAAQSRERLEELSKRLETTDLLILDNNFDLIDIVYSIRINDKNSPNYILDIPSNQKIPSNFLTHPPLSYLDSITNYCKLVDLVKRINPEIKIVFLNYPTSGFEYVQRKERRVLSAINFAQHFYHPEILIVPLLDMEPEYISQKGVGVFENEIYQMLSKYIARSLRKTIITLDPSKPCSREMLKKYLRRNKFNLFRKAKLSTSVFS